MSGFYVKYNGISIIMSWVYAVDTVRHEFLIVDRYDNFLWVPSDDCVLITMEEAESYVYD